MHTATTLTAAAITLAITPLCLAPPKAPSIIKPKLTKIVETRVANIADPDGNSFSFDTPELELTLEIELPAGVRIAEIIQPELFTATDSTGKDIVPPENHNGMFVNKVELAHMWDDDTAQPMTINLMPAARSAKTFSLNTKFNAVVFAGTKDIPVIITNSEAPLPANVFATAEPITAVLGAEDGQTTITLKPGAVRGLIETISINGSESAGSMWNDQFVTYYIPGQTDASAECTIKIRQNAASVPVLINIKDQPLP